jgi:hypothetical protein
LFGPEKNLKTQIKKSKNQKIKKSKNQKTKSFNKNNNHSN